MTQQMNNLFPWRPGDRETKILLVVVLVLAVLCGLAYSVVRYRGAFFHGQPSAKVSSVTVSISGSTNYPLAGLPPTFPADFPYSATTSRILFSSSGMVSPKPLIRQTIFRFFTQQSLLQVSALYAGYFKSHSWSVQTSGESLLAQNTFDKIAIYYAPAGVSSGGVQVTVILVQAEK
jgi:hypothetical protein